MISLFSPTVRVGLVVAAMATIFPVIAFAQPDKIATERTPAPEETTVANPVPVVDERRAGEDTPIETRSRVRVEVGIERLIEVESQHLFNELRGELLDERAGTINFWMAVFALVFALFGIVSFSEFRKLREQAQNIVAEIKEKRDEVNKIHRDVTANYADENPKETKRTIDKALETRQVSWIDRARARAVSLQRNGQREQASKIWQGIALVTEDQRLAARAWGSVGYLRGNASPEEAISAYNEAIRLDPDLAEAYSNRGNEKRKLGQYDEAIADFNEAIRLQPDYAGAYTNRGNVKIELGRYDEAIVDHDEAIRLQPNYADAYSNRGSAKIKLGQHDEAIVDCDKAIHLKPDYATAYNNRGTAKQGIERYDEAIADYSEAIRLQPNYAGAYTNRGNAKIKLGRYDEAIVDHDEAIRLQPDYADAYSNRGNAKIEMGRYDEAIADYNEAIRLQPNHAVAYNNRGEAKAGAGHNSEARKDYETALMLARKDNNPGLIALLEQALLKLHGES